MTTIKNIAIGTEIATRSYDWSPTIIPALASNATEWRVLANVEGGSTKTITFADGSMMRVSASTKLVTR